MTIPLFFKKMDKTPPEDRVYIPIFLKDGTELEGCRFCNSQLSITYDIKCLEKSIDYWKHEISNVLENHSGNDGWFNYLEIMEQRIEQRYHLKKELIKLKGIYNLD